MKTVGIGHVQFISSVQILNTSNQRDDWHSFMKVINEDSH